MSIISVVELNGERRGGESGDENGVRSQWGRGKHGGTGLCGGKKSVERRCMERGVWHRSVEVD